MSRALNVALLSNPYCKCSTNPDFRFVRNPGERADAQTAQADMDLFLGPKLPGGFLWAFPKAPFACLPLQDRVLEKRFRGFFLSGLKC